MGQSTSGYWHASEVLPEDLVAAVLEKVSGSTKITFALSHKTYNKSEMELPGRLVDKCRAALDKRGILTRRIILFGQHRKHLGGKEEAVALLELGYPARVVADALKYHPVTFRRWGVSELPEGKRPVPKVVETPETLDLGFKNYQELYPGTSADNSHYYAVGSAVLALREIKVVPVKKTKRY